MTDPHSQKILILDFGSQYTQLIARRVREAGVYCELHSWDSPLEEIRQFAPRGIILSGGPESVTLAETPRAPKEIFDMKIPILGICYGQQTMAAQLGERSRPGTSASSVTRGCACTGIRSFFAICATKRKHPARSGCTCG